MTKKTDDHKIRSFDIHPLASESIEAIQLWYEENFDQEMADDFSETVMEKLELLSNFNECAPEMLHRPGIRRLVITGRFPYYMFYRLTEKELVVLAFTKDADPLLD